MVGVDNNSDSIFGRSVINFRACWRALAITDIAFKIIAFIVLAPLSSLLLQGLLAAKGSAALSDLEILFFFFGPYGWVSLILLGATWLAFLVFEQAALITLAYARSENQSLNPAAALQFSFGHAWPIYQVTIRIVARTLACVAPVLLIAGGVYFSLLSEFDINYYLKEKPPVFIAAVGIGTFLGLILLAILSRIVSSWIFALPLVLFERVDARQALSLSAERVQGRRLKVLFWIGLWFIATTLISMAATSLVALMGGFIMPDASVSLQALTIRVGAILLLLAASGLVINLFSTTSFAILLLQLYRTYGKIDSSNQVLLPETTVSFLIGGYRITRPRLLAGTIIGLLVAATMSVFTLLSVRAEDDVVIMAHRGSSKSAPENTLASIRQAIEDGADWVEIDVQETADGEVVVFHDSDFMKLAGNSLKIWDARMEDLQKIDIGSWFDKKFQDERVPTLAKVLQECRDKIGVNIELKYYGHDQQLEQRVADLVQAYGMDSQVKAMSLKIEGVKKMKALKPNWDVGLLLSVHAGKVKNIEADFLAINASFAKRSLIRAAHEDGKEVYVWTVNDGPKMSEMISHGVDGILTDKPALARSVLEQRADMSVPERLLLEIAGMLGRKVEIGEQ